MNQLNSESIQNLLQRTPELIEHITHRLCLQNNRKPLFPDAGVDWQSASAVLFLLGRHPQQGRLSGEPCLILNKRSEKVRQPGDLCCPGGRVSPRLDTGLATFLKLPIFHLARWPHWPHWHKTRPRDAKRLRLLLATGVRESIEEMRLSPFGLKFLGPLPAQQLVMFQRVIYPMVVWVSGQKRFYPNWEVEKIIYIPLRDLLNPAGYARYRLRFGDQPGHTPVNIFPCFRYGKETRLRFYGGLPIALRRLF